MAWGSVVSRVSSNGEVRWGGLGSCGRRGVADSRRRSESFSRRVSSSSLVVPLSFASTDQPLIHLSLDLALLFQSIPSIPFLEKEFSARVS